MQSTRSSAASAGDLNLFVLHASRASLAKVATLVVMASLLQGATAREIDFNLGWRFMRGDPPGAAELTFQDLQWEEVATPHDWAIKGPFNQNEGGYAGKLPWKGVAWYRKWLMVDKREEGSRVYLDFDGVIASPKVFVNGKLAGEWDYGYTPFRVDLTDLVRFGRANMVAVRVDTTRHGTRWYPGAGIYRKVLLTVSPPVHLSKDGVVVTTPGIETEQAQVVVTSEVESHVEIDQPFEVEVNLQAPSGLQVAHGARSAVVRSGGSQSVRVELTAKNPQLWDIDHPALYTASIMLRIAGREVERKRIPFGIRSFGFTPDDGFVLNGRRVPLRGVNLHHDLGPLGTAFNIRAADRQLEIMQEMGANAIRTSHNPPAPEVLELCDRRGLLVWVELFDKWNETADRVQGTPKFEVYFARHTAAIARRDRNHPSLIAWSIGNEISVAPADPEGLTGERVTFARNEFLRHDPTRPVGLACCIPEMADGDLLKSLDLVGWNYQERYKLFRAKHPQTPIVYSESASAVSTRGAYRLPLPTTKCDYSNEPVVNAYECSAAGWSDLPEVEFDRLSRDDYLAGEFVWTGFDYLGEPTPYEQSARSTYFGAVDLAGLPKDRYYLYRSIWRPETPTIHIAPHRNWPDRIGKVVPVMVYTNGDSAELFLNGRSLGVRNKGARPAKAVDLAHEAKYTQGSLDVEGDSKTPSNEVTWSPGWSSRYGAKRPWLCADLGGMKRLRSVVLEFPRESKLYGYRIEISDDGKNWEQVAQHGATQQPMWGGVPVAIHHVECDASLVRLVFENCLDTPPALNRLGLYDEPYQSDYHDATYDYRIRWDDVAYEPGELRVVAFGNGKVLGEKVVRTAGAAAGLRIQADRSLLEATGLDLSFLTVEAIDGSGVTCPLADNNVRVSVKGAGAYVCSANGDPTSLVPFHKASFRLFYGKAVIVVRAEEGLGDSIDVSVEADGLKPATATLRSRRLGVSDPPPDLAARG